MPFNQFGNSKEISPFPQRVRDVLGRLKVVQHQNRYDADFEYGTQPLRWEAVTAGSGSVAQIPNQGGVRMQVGNAQGDVALRQSRPYHRYQPGKTMFMATGCLFGPATAGQVQRVGFFDDTNGVFFEQSFAGTNNPQGMYCVIRTDVGGTVQETRVPLDQWNGDKQTINTLDFNKIQMFWIEFAWYGAGVTRFGFWINGEPRIAHQIGWGNYANPLTGGSQQTPWARTGNLPVRYEIRNTAAVTPTTSAMYHYGVSVLIEGGSDEQRGFTYSYGMSPTAPVRTITAGNPTVRSPVLSIRSRALGTLEYGNILGLASSGAAITATAQSSAVFTGTISGTILTVTGVTSGTVAANQVLEAFGLVGNTYIVSNISGSGVGSTWTINQSQAVGTTTFTGNYTSVTLTGTPLTANQYQGRYFYMAGVGTTGTSAVGRVISNTTSVIYFADPVLKNNTSSFASITTTANATPTGSAGGAGAVTFTVSSATGIAIGQAISGTGLQNGTYVTGISGTTVSINRAMTAGASGTYTFSQGYAIGIPNRGQLLPKRLMCVQTTAAVNVTVEVVASTPSNPVVLTGAAFQPLSDLGSIQSFAERDVTATAMSGGEVVFAFVLSPGAGVQDIDFTYFFPMFNTVRGNQLDTLTVAVSFPGTTAATVGAHLICQEAMS